MLMLSYNVSAQVKITALTENKASNY